MQHKAFSNSWHYTLGPQDPPDMTPCDFFLWGYVKERVYVPPLPADLDEHTNNHGCSKFCDRRHSQTVWDELSYRVDVVRAAGGGHIERL